MIFHPKTLPSPLILGNKGFDVLFQITKFFVRHLTHTFFPRCFPGHAFDNLWRRFNPLPELLGVTLVVEDVAERVQQLINTRDVFRVQIFEIKVAHKFLLSLLPVRVQ